MKSWARWFYESLTWRKTSRDYIDSVSGLCERCSTDDNPVPAVICHHRVWLAPNNINDPDITLNWDNLEALCMDCHNKEHKRKEPKRYRFDECGRILPPVGRQNEGHERPRP